MTSYQPHKSETTAEAAEPARSKRGGAANNGGMGLGSPWSNSELIPVLRQEDIEEHLRDERVEKRLERLRERLAERKT